MSGRSNTERVDPDAKLKGGGVEVDWNQRDRVHQWPEATQRNRRRAWADWLRTQRLQSSGKIIRWAQRCVAEDIYGGLSAGPDKVRQTIEAKPEAPVQTSGSLWQGGVSYESDQWG